VADKAGAGSPGRGGNPPLSRLDGIEFLKRESAPKGALRSREAWAGCGKSRAFRSS